MRTRRASPARRTLVDASAFFALLDNDDANHVQALTIRERLIAEGWRLFTTSFILLNRLSQAIATRFLQEMEHTRPPWCG
jgi:predicted nucleic acid-binding protein